MDQLVKDQLVATEKYSPYRFYAAERWAEFAAGASLTLTQEEVRRLSSLNDPIDLDEVRRIYLSMSRLLSVHVEASQTLFRERRSFFNVPHAVKTPFIIGIAGSVAVSGTSGDAGNAGKVPPDAVSSGPLPTAQDPPSTGSPGTKSEEGEA